MDEVIRGFACKCGDENKQEIAEFMERVCRDRKCPPEEIVSAVCYGLKFIEPEGLYVTGIDVDQWCQVEAVTESFSPVKFEIQCDLVEHGFAMLWEKVIERFPQDDT